MSRYIGFDLRSIIQDIKVLNTDIDQVALQIHISLQYNSSNDIVYRYKSFNNLLKLFQHIRRYRKIKLIIIDTKFWIILGHSLSFIYLFVKILYLINCLCQFYLLSHFLSFPFYKFGYEWLMTLLKQVHTRANTESHDSKWFPRVVMCDFMVRHLGSNQHWM
jgi:hypothetical protein